MQRASWSPQVMVMLPIVLCSYNYIISDAYGMDRWRGKRRGGEGKGKWLWERVFSFCFFFAVVTSIFIIVNELQSFSSANFFLILF